MAKKGFIKDLNNIEILPITRGELVIDSSGNLAFHSNEFLATDSLPGLMSAEDKAKIDNLENSGPGANNKVAQVNTTTNEVYRLLFSETADDEDRTEGARKSAKLLFNPFTGVLTASFFDGKLEWSNLNNVPDSFTPSQHTHTTNEIVGLTGYTKAESPEDLIITDTLNIALGKLEYKADTVYTWYRSVTDADTDNIVNKWEEIVDFIDSIEEGTDITDEFVTRKTGQTITGEKIFSGTSASLLTIDRNSTNPTWIKFAKNNNLLGYIGIDNAKKPVVNIDEKVYYILHSGNSSVTKSGQTLTVTINGTSQSLTNSTYNFSGTFFTSGNQNIAEHDANNITSNGVWYYTANGPATSLGASTTDGALYSQAYSTSWVGQIAQNYRNGDLFTRGRNNGTWTAWKKVAYVNDIPTVTNYYWADIPVSSTSSTTTKPTFGLVTTPRIDVGNYVFMNYSGEGIYLNNNGLHWHTNRSYHANLLNFTSIGNVGVGTGDPLARFHVNGNTYINKRLSIGTLLNPYNSSRASIDLITSGAYPTDLFLGADGIRYWSITARNTSDSLSKGFGIHDMINSVYRMVITSVGNIGIGTSDPAYRLDVINNARIASIVMEINDEINRYGGTLYLLNRGTVAGSAGNTGNVAMVCNGGNVGVGIASPNYKLDVKGTFNSSNYQAGGALELKTDDTACQTTVFGSNGSGYKMRIVRQATSTNLNTLYSPTLVLSCLDTHAYIAWSYSSDSVWVGGGSSNKWNWRSKLVTSANYGSYLGYIGTTAVLKSSAAQALTGISDITMSGNILIHAENNDRFLIFSYANLDRHSWRLGYLGTGTGDANYLVLQGTKETSGNAYTNAMCFHNNNFDVDFAGSINAPNWTTSKLNLVSNSSGGQDLGMRVDGSTNSIGFIIGSGNTNRGIYDYTNSIWILYKNATIVGIPAWASKGNSTTPVYFNSSGTPIACTSYADYIKWTSADPSLGIIGKLTLGSTTNILYDLFITSNGTVIAANTDLNTIKTPGIRYSGNSTNSATLTNAPWTSSGFRLITLTGYSSASNYGILLALSSKLFFWRTMGSSNASPSSWYSWILFEYGTAVGNSTTPIYINSSGVPTACTAYSGLLTALSSSSSTNLSITVGGTTKTITDMWATNLANKYSSRPTTITPGVTGDGGMFQFKCTSSVTDTATDPGDGHILHFNWDNTGGYDAQLFLPTSSSALKVRGMSGGTWQSWATVLTNLNYTSYLGYIGTTAVQSSSAVQTLTGINRISNSTSAVLYLGNSGNQSWVMTQDICSHSGTGNWAINTAGTGWFKVLNVGYTYSTSGSYAFNVTGTAGVSKLIVTTPNLYREAGGIILNNSDIWGLNAIYTLDLADSATEGYLFKRTNGNYDSLWCKDGVFYFSPNGNSTNGYGANYTVWHSGNDGSGSGLDADTLDGYQASALISGYYLKSAAITAASAGWYKIASYSTTGYSPRGNIKFLINTNGGNHTPGTVEFSLDLSWSLESSSFRIAGYNPLSFKVRFGKDANNMYIEVYFPLAITSNCYLYVPYSAYSMTMQNNAWTWYTGALVKSVATSTSAAIGGVSGLALGGNVYAPHFYESSDKLLKTNIKPISDSDNIPVLKEFDWKKDGTHGYGLIAQELEAMGYSELVDGEEDGSKTVNYSAALSLIVGKLQVKIKELEKEIENLKNKN